MKKILIIQPHSDDALLSCYNLIVSSARNVEILTIESDEKRQKEDLILESTLGCKIHFLDSKIQDQSYYKYWKENTLFEEDAALDCCIECYTEVVVMELVGKIKKFIEVYKKNNPDAIIYAPLGVCHPFHLLVRDSLWGIANYYYRDFPHSYKRRGEVFMKSLLRKGEFILSNAVDIADVKELKLAFFKEIYKTQSSIAWFEKGYFEKINREEFYILKPF